MGLIIKPTDFTASTTIVSSEVDDNFDTIYDEFNGAIDSANLATDAVVAANISSNAVTTVKVLDANITSAKLAESFFRGRFQAITSNSAPTGLTSQWGWSFIPGTGADEATKTITFPTAFAAAPTFVSATCLGFTTTTPSAITEFTSETGSGPFSITISDITTTTMLVQIARSDGVTFNSAVIPGFCWEARAAV